MKTIDSSFSISFLDHVAIRVKDIEASCTWYQEVLGLTKYQKEEWGPFPVIMLVGKTGLALFPANENDPKQDPNSKNVKIDHFAFNVDHDNFKLAKEKYEALNLNFVIQNHHHFHSIYTKDPDGHTVELTTLVVDEKTFYQL